MNRLKELAKTNNIVKLSLILLPIVIMLLSATLAYYNWGSTENTNIAFDVVADTVYIYYDAGADIIGKDLYPTDDKNDGIVKEITVRVEKESKTAKFNLYLDLKTLPDALKHNTFKYEIYQGTTLKNSGNFTETGSTCTTNGTNHIVLLSDVTPTTTETAYTLYIWIDGTIGQNPDTMMNQSFEFTLHADGVNVTGAPTEITTQQDPSNANVPNIVDGMIPVYYSFDDGQWHKADQTNTDYNWFNYSEKKWANVVLLNSDTARETYTTATNGTTIDMDDIAAFYVWIPRYKYRVWNISRQNCASTDTATCEATYAYTAYSTGIEIEFESGTSSTGNVSCEYNVSNSSNPSTLSDTCTVDGTTITTSTDNTTFTGDNEAWYTHPAFTFGTGNEITGFWVGKFETTGSASSPEIKPNVAALVNQNVAAQFTTSQLFGSSATYGITESGLKAHMLKNLEWGAVAYLSYSDYGMCKGTSCTGMYINNAYNSTTYVTTGRSGGAIAGSPETVATHYPDSGSTSTNLYSDYGYYTYDGKEVAYDGTIGDYASDTTLGTNASTTGNVYGVYDMNGGSYEYVMADMYSIPTGTYVGPIGTAFSGFNGVDNTGATLYSSGNALLATVTSSSITTNTDNLKYYDSYSYGTTASAQTAWNSSRLGDATGEVVSGTSSTYAWKPGSGVNGSRSYFVGSGYSWFDRGGRYNLSSSGPFGFDSSSGAANPYFSFRSSLS